MLAWPCNVCTVQPQHSHDAEHCKMISSKHVSHLWQCPKKVQVNICWFVAVGFGWLESGCKLP